MKPVFVLLLLPAFALASKPRAERIEAVQPVAAVEAPTEPKKPRDLVITADVGVGEWWSSLAVATTFEGSFGFGARLSRHVLLSGELGIGVGGSPTLRGEILSRLALTAVLAWDVLELVRRLTYQTFPFEAGVELGLGIAAIVDRQFIFGLPLVQVGVFARYVFSPSLSLGLRLRGHVPFWVSTPRSFHGAYIGSTTEPSGFTVTASVIRTF